MNVEGTNMYLSSEARRATELLQHKDILFREMQHRVANSLQIIASILSFPKIPSGLGVASSGRITA